MEIRATAPGRAWACGNRAVAPALVFRKNMRSAVSSVSFNVFWSNSSRACPPGAWGSPGALSHRTCLGEWLRLVNL